MDQPNGYQVASTNVTGAAGNLRDVGLRFLSGIIDVELTQRMNATPDRAELEARLRTAEARTSSPLVDTLRAITPGQWAAIAGVGVLGFGVFAGWFR